MINPSTYAAASAATPTALAPATTATQDASRVDAFRTAMERRETVEAAPQQVQGTAPADADAQLRARQGLNIDNPPNPAAGDMILEGMQKLRGVFDQSQSRVTELMNRSSIDSRTMMQMQMEVSHFTLMVDISSKLTGKSTQAFDTLMKGQ